MRLLSQVRGVRADEIPGLLVNTFGGYSASRANPQWVAMVERDVTTLVDRLLQAGLAEREGEVAQRFGHQMPQMLQRYCRDQIEFWARCKRAALLYDWIEGTPVDVLEKHYSTTPFGGAIGYGNIIGIADATRFHLRSAHQILAALFPDQPDFLKSWTRFFSGSNSGCPPPPCPSRESRCG